MSYDGIVTHCVVDELCTKIINGKIDKVYQPENDEIILSIRTFTGNYRLLLSASASNPRVHLTEVSKENPMSPPMLCMLMRKHLQGGKIISITQDGYDRTIRVGVESYNELGDLTVKYIIVEIMGRHSNIILLDEKDKIMDSAKHVDFTVSAVRQVLPGLIYTAPPSQEKMLPDQIQMVDLMNALSEAGDDVLLDKFLVGQIMGMSPLLAREIVYRFSGHVKMTAREVDTASFVTFAADFLKHVCAGKYQPALVIDEGEKRPAAFSCVALLQYENACKLEYHESISQVIDIYYKQRSIREHINQRSNALVKLVHNHINRCEKKLCMHQENLKKSQNREQYKMFGDLLTANLYQVRYGMDKICVQNFYSETGEEIEIPLLKEKSPAQNAQRYYKLYNKAKVTEKYATEQIKEAKGEKYYLESVAAALEQAESPAELAEIRDELADSGYLPKIKSKMKKHQKKSAPLKFLSKDGYEILVGRNNKQNDELTIRMAYSTDLWFHTKIIPGSHTIVRTNGEGTAPDTTIAEAAKIAAYYSKAQNSSKVPVDYTQVKNVKKPNGAKPGMVIYDHYRTLYVDPEKPVQPE